MNKNHPKPKLLVLAFAFVLSLLLLPGLARAADADVTQPGDPIVGSSGNVPAGGNEGPDKVIDNNTGSKYLNFDKLNTGFTVTPAMGGTRISGINIASANDAPERDPASYTVEGSTDGTTWSLIAAGKVGTYTARGQWKNFTFPAPSSAIYTQYRVMFPTVAARDKANSMQVSEVELPGTAETSDTWAPFVSKAEATTLTSIRLHFSEPVNIAGATFEVSGGVTATAALDANPSIVILTTSDMIPGNTYTVTINGLVDAANNAVSANYAVQVFASTGVSAMGYSVDFSGRTADGVPQVAIEATDEVGVVARKNWNFANTVAYGTDSGTAPLVDGSGLQSDVTLRFQANDSWYNDTPVPAVTPTEKMMQGVLKAGGRGTTDTLTWQNVPNATYYMVTYHSVNGDNAWVDMTAGGTTYYFVEQHRFTAPWTRATNTNDPATRTRANYVLFSGLTRDANNNIVSTMLFPTTGGDGDGNGISGMQLIPAPGLVQIAGSRSTQIKLEFIDPVTDESASPANFILSGGLEIAGVTLSEDFKTIYIDTVAPMVKGSTYWVTMNNIQDRTTPTIALPANAMASFVGVASPDIAVNFSGANTTTTPSRLAANEVAGVEPVANWNNVDTSGYYNDFLAGDKRMNAALPLKDTDGAATPVTITFVADEQWGSETSASGPNGAGDAKLMNGYLGPSNGDYDRDIIFNNVPNGNYKVIVYTLRDGSGEGEAISLNGGTPYEVRSEGQGDWNGNPAFRRGTSTDAANRQLCNYVQFGDETSGFVSPVNNTFKITFRAKTFRAPCTGIQLVAADLVPVSLTKEPVDTTVRENEYFTLTAEAVGTGPRTYQWYLNDGPIDGANGLTYTALATCDLNGARYKLSVNNAFSSAESSNATLTVTIDNVRPRVTGFAGGPPADDKVAVTFSEPVTVVTAEVPGNYILAGGQGAVVGASLQPGQKTVLLTVDPPLAGGVQYTLTVSGVQDTACAANFIDPNPTVISFDTQKLVCTNGFVKREWYYDIGGGTAVADLTNNIKWPNRPDAVDYVTSMNSPQTSPDVNNYGASLTALIQAPVSGNYQFVINSDDSGLLWLSPTPRADQKQQIIWLNGCCRDEFSQPVYLVGGLWYYVQAIWKEGGGGDDMFVRWKLPGASGYSEIPAGNLATCVTNDLIAPTLVAAYASPVPNQVVVKFSKPMADSSLNPAAGSYAIVTNAAGAVLNVTNAAAYGSDLSRAVLTLDGNIEAGVTYTVTIGGAGVNDRTFNANHITPDPSSVQVTGLAAMAGVTLREKWLTLENFDIYGNTLAFLTNNADYPCNPDVQEYVDTFDITNPNNAYDATHSGGRLRTYIVPSVSGNYTFRENSDDAGIVYLGSSPADKQAIIYQAGCCADLFSPAIPLQAGVAYYLEALYENGTGGDYIHVTWKGPSDADYVAIAPANMFYALDPSTVAITVTTQPVDATVLECRVATFTAAATVSCGAGSASYQWYKGISPIAGATSPTLNYLTALGDDGAAITVQISVPGKSVITSPATLHVQADIEPPTLVSAKGDKNMTNIFITFSENVDPATAGLPENYNVTLDGTAFGSNGGFPLGVKVNGNVVILNVDAMPQGALLTVAVNNVFDQCVKNVTDIGSSITVRAWALMPYTATFEVYKSFGGGTIPDLIGNPSFPDSPAETYFIGNFDSRQAYIADLDNDPSHNNYGGRISAWFKAPATGTYVFYSQGDDDVQVSISPDANPANKTNLMAWPCCNGDWNDTRSVTNELVAGQLYYLEMLYKEGGGGDYGRLAVRVPGDTTANGSLYPIGPQYLWTMMDPDSIQTLPTTGMLPTGSLTVRGFENRLSQINVGLSNLYISTAELVLAGTYGDTNGVPYPNVARAPSFTECNIINYNIENNEQGRLRPDAKYPGLPGYSNSFDNFALEANTYVHLTAGLHAFAVNSDDNFRVTSGGVTLGEFNWVTGRGASDTVFRFYAPVEGLYPMRLVMVNGGGGGNVEWWAADAVTQTINPINSAFVPAYIAGTAAQAPAMTLTRQGANVVVTWPSAGCPQFDLWTSSSLGVTVPASWVKYTGTVNFDGVTKSATIPVGAGNLFFRLQSQ